MNVSSSLDRDQTLVPPGQESRSDEHFQQEENQNKLNTPKETKNLKRPQFKAGRSKTAPHQGSKRALS